MKLVSNENRLDVDSQVMHLFPQPAKRNSDTICGDALSALSEDRLRHFDPAAGTPADLPIAD